MIRRINYLLVLIVFGMVVYLAIVAVDSKTEITEYVGSNKAIIAGNTSIELIESTALDWDAIWGVSPVSQTAVFSMPTLILTGVFIVPGEPAMAVIRNHITGIEKRYLIGELIDDWKIVEITMECVKLKNTQEQELAVTMRGTALPNTPADEIGKNFIDETGLVGYWPFSEGAGATTADLSGNNNTGKLNTDGIVVTYYIRIGADGGSDSNDKNTFTAVQGLGPAWADGKLGKALSFDGGDAYVGTEKYLDITNYFTMEMWINSLATHQIDTEGTSGGVGTEGQRYALWPTWGDSWDDGHAGAGISAGINGISVYEHAHNYMPALLVWQGTLSGWTHVVVVYENKQPRLYVDGVLVRTGLTSAKMYVHPSIERFGGSQYGSFSGLIDEVKIYNRALSSYEISARYNLKK